MKQSEKDQIARSIIGAMASCSATILQNSMKVATDAPGKLTDEHLARLGRLTADVSNLTKDIIESSYS